MGGGPVPGDPVPPAAQQGGRAAGVATREMGQPDGELGQALPQGALAGVRGLPRGLEHLVGMERPAGVEQALRLEERLARGEDEIVRDARDAGRPARERTTQTVPRAVVARPAQRIPLARARPARFRPAPLRTGTAHCLHP